MMIDLEYWEMRNLLKAIRGEKYQMKLAMRKPFVPEDGKINVNEAALASLNSAGDKILAAIKEHDKLHGEQP